MAIPNIEQLMAMTISGGFDQPVPVGFYNGVITKTEVRQGQKGAYLSIEVTLHDDEYKGRKVWRNASFSEKAIGMPGGIAELVQATKPEISRDLPGNELPAVLAKKVTSCPVRIEVEHEQVKRNGVPQELEDGSPEMRAQVRCFIEPTPDFIATIEAQAAGVDEDLPF